MSFRRRVILFTAVAVAVAIVLASVLVYLLVRSELRGRIDTDLRRDATRTFAAPIVRNGRLVLPTGPLGGPSVSAQLVEADGSAIRPARPTPRLDADPRCPGGRLRRAGGLLLGPRARRHALPRLHRAGRARRGGPGRPLAGGDRRCAARAGADPRGGQPRRDRPRSRARAARLADGALPRRPARPSRPRGRRDPRPEPAHRPQRRRRAGRAGSQLQHDAERARELASTPSASSSPTPRTSCAPRSPACAPTSRFSPEADQLSPEQREGLLADVVSQLDELTLLVGDLVDLARDVELDGEPAGRCGSTGVVEGAVERTRTRAPGVRISVADESLHRARGRGRPRPGGLQPARQRGQVEPQHGEVEVEVRAADGRSRSATTARASSPPTCPGSSIASIAPPRLASCRGLASAWRSSGG